MKGKTRNKITIEIKEDKGIDRGIAGEINRRSESQRRENKKLNKKRNNQKWEEQIKKSITAEEVKPKKGKTRVKE